MGQRVGLHADPYFDPEFFERKNTEKQLISFEISCFMVAGGGLEPPTSGL
jgi:hypothetical protein